MFTKLFLTGFLRSSATWLQLAAFRLARAAERLLPRPLLSLALWPAASAWAVLDWDKIRQAMAARDRFPKAWRPDWFPFFLRQSIGFAHSRLVYLWPDHLPEKRWLRRCRLKGNFNLQELRDGAQPIIFASLHFGPYRTLPYWLRAHDIVTTALVGRPISAQGAVLDALSAPAEIPPLAAVNSIASLRRSLGPGRRLLIFTDVPRGRQVEVPLGKQTFSMATGAIRLAAATGAKLIPCLIVENGIWNFAIHFGTAVPPSLLERRGEGEAASHLLGEWLYVISHYPAQCRHRFLTSITPAPVDPPQDGARLWLELPETAGAR